MLFFYYTLGFSNNVFIHSHWFRSLNKVRIGGIRGHLCSRTFTQNLSSCLLWRIPIWLTRIDIYYLNIFLLWFWIARKLLFRARTHRSHFKLGLVYGRLYRNIWLFLWSFARWFLFLIPSFNFRLSRFTTLVGLILLSWCCPSSFLLGWHYRSYTSIRFSLCVNFFLERIIYYLRLFQQLVVALFIII